MQNKYFEFNKSGKKHCFATAAKGLEPVVAKELDWIGAESIRENVGGVAFSGDLELLYKACLYLRTAHKVLIRIDEFSCRNEQDLYNGIYKMPWDELIKPSNTLAIDATVRDSKITHSRYAALKSKDAVVDRIRARYSSRPNIELNNPDFRINIHIRSDECTVSLDATGDSLHRRGYRKTQGPAPLKETLAAGLVLLSGWNGQVPLVDPMCGSGTIVIEAALIAANIAPGLFRDDFTFQKWPDYDDMTWKRLRSRARQRIRQSIDIPIIGFDKSRRAIDAAQSNAEMAGIDHIVRFETKELSRLSVPEQPGIIIVNPPYGERIGEHDELITLYKELGDVLKNKCRGYTAYVFTGNMKLAKSIGLRTSQRIPLFNGPIESRLLRFELF